MRDDLRTKSGGRIIGAFLCALMCVTNVAAGADDRPSPAPVPDGAAVARASSIVDGLFKPDFAKKGSADRLSLAARLRSQAASGADDAATRYVLLRRARDLAIEANDFDAAFVAVDDLAAAFKVDATSLKLETLSGAAGGARTASTASALTAAACALGESTLARGDFAAAAKASSLATTASRRARDADVVARAKMLAKGVAQARADERQFHAATQALQRDPANATANLAAGRFLCFVKDDWAAGLPLLAKSSEPRLKALAETERTRPADPDSMVALGDAWWDLPYGRGDVSQAQARQRAAYWYRKALPKLKGLKTLPVEARLLELRLALEAQLPRVALERLTPLKGKHARLISEGLELQQRTAVMTPDELRVPVRIDVVARTDKDNLRLYFGERGEVIFNWELNGKELRVHDPATGAHHGIPNQGFIEPGKWAAITWLIEPRQMVVVVDGKQRAVVEGNFGDVRGKAGVGAIDSTVTVRSWRFAPATAQQGSRARE